jgi:chromosome segregation protein
MKIKRLEIVGFKSFVDKISLNFQHGITGVVGPNGCGKSNIVDAIRWVMGEQNARHLRGRMMEDVIFGGSEVRKPHGLAQVSIVFDNSAGICPPAYKEFAEIMITRCLHRSGDSEYRINKTPCRLLDITELFMDTGVGARAYSIIEQGKVGMLVSAKPEERRALIEEAAGVTKFKARKKTALRKMDATRQNLVRLGDIVTEVRRQISSLKRQAQKAEKFKDYRGEVKRIELIISGNRFQHLKRETDLVAKREKEQTTILARLDARLEDGELQLSEQQLQLSVAESDYGRAQEQNYKLGAEVQRVENELVLSTRQKEHFMTQVAELQTERAGLVERLTELQSEYAALVSQKDGFGGDLEELQARVKADELALKDEISTEQQLNQQHDSCRTELMELLSQSSRLANRREEIARRLESESERRNQIQRESQTVQDQQDILTSEREQLLAKLELVRTQVEEQKEQLEEWTLLFQAKNAEQKQKEQSQNEIRRKLEKARSMQQSLQELQHSGEGYGEGTRLLLADSNRHKKVVADLLRVSEEYETAIEVALEDRLQAVIAENLADCSPALDSLKGKQSRASLLIPIENSPALAFIGGTPIADLITSLSEHAQTVTQLLSGVYLVDSVPQLLGQALPAGVLLVDRQGYRLDWRGLLSGGDTRVSGSGLLRRQRQLDELAETVDKADLDHRVGQKVCEQLEDELLEIEEQRSYGISQSHRLDLQLVELGKDRQGLQLEEERLNKRLALVIYDLEQIDEGSESLRVEDQRLLSELGQGGERQKQLDSQVVELSSQLTAIRTGLEQKREKLTTARVSFASLQQQQHALTETLRRVDQQQGEIERRSTQLLQRQESVKESCGKLALSDVKLKAELEVLLNRREELQKKTELAREQYDDQKVLLDEFREQLRRVRSEAEELRKMVAQLQLRQHEFQVDTEHIRQTVLDRYRVDLAEHQVPEATEDELDRQQQQLKRLQQKIESLGEVNLMAIDEYREQEERYDFLSRQREDLNQSLDDLQKAISQINRTTRRRFKETFELVNEKFKQVFPRLFRGGQAELRLSDENDLLETGVDIIVQPPGKRLQSVNLLSGGEKALTAVALIFSLFLIKPTPFCILDEVDAPLDDINIDRFAEIVREMTEQSQFIIITHSKRTMAIVDTMYGVTMQEPGVSKLVSVRLNDLPRTGELQSA